MTISLLPTDPAPPPASGGVLGYLAAHKLLTGIIGVVAVAVITVVAVVFATGVTISIGGGGDLQDFILEDASFVEIIDNAAILAAEEIPGNLYQRFGYSHIDDPEEWKEEWRENFKPELPYEIADAIIIDDITYIVRQDDASGNRLDSLLLTGNFEFADIRDSLNDEFEEADEYRGFEVWDRRNVALVEDRGIVILGDEMVRGVLKALDTGRGSLAAVTEDSRDGRELKRALDKAGEGMFTYGFTDCDIPSVDSLIGCKAAVWVIKGGDIDATQWGYVYVFTSERRAESGMDDIEESILESEEDIDIDLIEIDGDLVTIDVTIHHEP